MKAQIPSARAADRLQVLAAALLFSTGGAAIKACDLSSWQIASFRCGIAAVVILIVLPGARRNWGPRTLLVGVAYAATMILFVIANKLTTAANTIFLQGTAPLYLLLLGPWLLGERTRRSDLVFTALLLGGMVLFFVFEELHEKALCGEFTFIGCSLNDLFVERNSVFFSLFIKGNHFF